VTNLIDNAVKWSFTGELIHIRGQVLPGWVVFTVEDQGTGIPDDRKKAIFEEPFLRKVLEDKKRFIAGTGIGLKIAKKIVDAHHGTISVTSVPFLDDPRRQGPEHGHVVTFTVRLPWKLSPDEKTTRGDDNKEKE
jgi:signal transduction histidine kinase